MKWFICSLLFLPIACSAQENAPIDKEGVTAVINMLASDAMEGRKAGTLGAQKAAAFIAKSFDEAGLQQMAGMKEFRHKFTMTEVSPGEGELVLNGVTIKPEAFAFRGGDKTININSLDNFEVVHIAADANPRSNFGQILNGEKPTIALMDPAHGDFFARIHGFLKRPDMQTGQEKKSVKIFVNTAEKEATSLSFKGNNQHRDMAFANVVGILPGKNPDAQIMFSAHYDHLGRIAAVDGDDIANGADDDASGVTGLIMLARHFAMGPKPERTLLFVAFTAEEMGTLGSRAFAKVVTPDNIVAGINMEMIGKPSKFGKGQLFLTGFDRSDLGTLMQKRLEGSAFGLHPDPYPKMNLFFRSDNAPFARLGVPAHTFSTVEIDKDKFYHTVNDEVETLDMEHFTAAIQGVSIAVRGLVYEQETPSRLPVP